MRYLFGSNDDCPFRKISSNLAIMDKDFILEQIKSIASQNGGQPLGVGAFEKATGIKPSDWSGRYWARWGDAILEAGFQPNKMNASYDETFLLEKFVSLIRELQKFPVRNEVKLKCRSDKSFPSYNVFTNRWGKKSDCAKIIKSYCERKGGLEDVIKICLPHIKSEANFSDDNEQNIPSLGYVYLLKSGKYYKIGYSNNPDRRLYEIGIQLPEKVDHIHSIETDDPSGIEAYWHTRFREKRLHGEWFDLKPSDIRIFRRRKFM